MKKHSSRGFGWVFDFRAGNPQGVASTPIIPPSKKMKIDYNVHQKAILSKNVPEKINVVSCIELAKGRMPLFNSTSENAIRENGQAHISSEKADEALFNELKKVEKRRLQGEMTSIAKTTIFGSVLFFFSAQLRFVAARFQNYPNTAILFYCVQAGSVF